MKLNEGINEINKKDNVYIKIKKGGVKLKWRI